MFESDEQSWNLRDTHMFEMLVRILDVYGHGSAGAVWAHNSHLGDASATAMASRGELNVGQLVRERFGQDAYAVGFGTHDGTVTAASSWGGRPRTMTMRPSNANSYERLFHDAGLDAASIPLREDQADVALRETLLEPRLERAIGVIYRPETRSRPSTPDRPAIPYPAGAWSAAADSWCRTLAWGSTPPWSHGLTWITTVSSFATWCSRRWRTSS